jgi:hypothetical protein
MPDSFRLTCCSEPVPLALPEGIEVHLNRCTMTPILIVILILFLLLYKPTRIPVLAVLAIGMLVWLLVAH